MESVARSRSIARDGRVGAIVAGPVMSEDAFDRYVRQTMQIEFDEYIEPLDKLHRLPIEIIEDGSRSLVAEVEPARLIEALNEEINVIDPEVAYEQAMAQAHDEDVSEWGEAIRNWLSQRDQSVSLLILQRGVGMSLVQVWLALLLNEFAIEQRGEFYQTEQIWIAP